MDPAPADFDGLMHWLWVNYEKAGDEQAAEAIRNLDPASTPEALDGDEGELTRLTREEIAHVRLVGDHDPARARGLFKVTHMPCTLDRLEELLYRLDQDQVHDGAYESYERTYTSSIDDYKARSAPTITWTSRMTSNPPVGGKYTEEIEGGLRRVPSLDAQQSPWGPVLLARTWLPSPAVFEGDGSSFPQDYQIEAYWERAPGDVTHVFGVWREMKMGSFDTEGDALVSLQLDGFADWDEQTAEHCK